MHFLYSLAVGLTLIVGMPFWLWQIARKPRYRAGLTERLGRIPAARVRPTSANENCVWIHAVSVGEVLAIARLVTEFKKKFPEWRVVVSTTTLTGQTLARQRFGEGEVFYLPLDLRVFLRPLFRHLRPRALVMAESEFWPNLLDEAAKNACRVAVVNARVSDRSFPRYRRFRGLLEKYVFAQIDLVLAQSELDAERLRQIGVPKDRLQVSGNVKFDLQPPAESSLARTLQQSKASTKVIVLGSTVEGEERLLAPAIEGLRDQDVAFVVAPRHPERFDAVATLLSDKGLAVVRRSEAQSPTLRRGAILLLDSIGELAAVYALADIAFVGGSLVPHGGHNILEPAHFGKPIVIGPHMENFRDVAQKFADAGALVSATAESLPDVITGLLADEARRVDLGRRAKQVLEGNTGATARTLSALEVLLWMPQTLRAQMSRGQQ